jgi:hypothetical protein
VPALGPVTIQSDNGTNYFGRIAYPFGAESGIKVEGALPLDTQLTASLSYDAVPKILTLTMSTSSGPLDINSSGDLGEVGGFDGDIATIQLYLPFDVLFAVDRLAIPLWSIPAASGSGSVVVADVLFDSLSVDMPGLLLGDANGDSVVDGGDYTAWADHYLQFNQTVVSGDFTGDGLVDGADYTVWADHYQPSSFGAAAASAVPEPATTILAAIGCIVLIGFRGICRRTRLETTACPRSILPRRRQMSTRRIGVVGTDSPARVND